MSKTKNYTSQFQFPENYPGIVFHGASFNDYYRPHSIEVRQGKGNHKKKTIKIYKSSIPCWEKILFFIDSHYRYTPYNQSPYFVSTFAIYETLKKYGNYYSLRHVQKQIKRLEADGFLAIVKYPSTEEELKVNPKNKHLRRRKLLPDIEKINKYISIFDEEDPLFKELPDRDPLKKLVRQRPYSYIGENQEVIEEKFNEYIADENGVLRRKPYKNPKELFTFWCMTVSSKYYNVDSLTKKFIPTNLDNQQEVVDRASINKASSKGILDRNILMAYQDNLDELSDAEASILIGWKAPPDDSDMITVLNNMGYVVSAKGFVTSFKRPNKDNKPSAYKEPTERQIAAGKAFYNRVGEPSKKSSEAWDEEDN